MVKIEKDKPLPKHTKLRYEECYAKVFLEHFYPNDFKNLIIKDKPDLRTIDNKVGIEVVDAVDKKYKEAYELWSDSRNCSNDKLIKNIERMKQLGFDFFNRHYQVWPAYSYDKGIESNVFNPLFIAIIDKFEKLNKKIYETMDKYYLCIYSEFWIRDNWISDLYLKLSYIRKNYELKYGIIYVLTQDKIIKLDYIDNCFEKYSIVSVQYDLSWKARHLVEEGEEDE